MRREFGNAEILKKTRTKKKISLHYKDMGYKEKNYPEEALRKTEK
jgi:hypothetical protein